MEMERCNNVVVVCVSNTYTRSAITVQSKILRKYIAPFGINANFTQKKSGNEMK